MKTKTQNEIENGAIIEPQIPNTPKEFRKFIVDSDKTVPKAVDIWQRRLNVTIDSDIWESAAKCTKEIRLRLLHFKILYSIYPTNKMLYKMDKAENIYCSFCPGEVDTLKPFLF